MTKQQFIKLIGNVDDDLIENYLGSPVDENRPTKVYTAKSGALFGKWAAFAAAVVCVIAMAVFFAANRRVPVDPDGPGDNTSVFSEISSDDSGESSMEQSDLASSSDVTSENPDSGNPEPQPFDIGNGMILTGTPLDNSMLEEFSIEPYIEKTNYSDADKQFFEIKEIPEIKDIYMRAGALFGCLSTTEFSPTFSAVGNDRVPARIKILRPENKTDTGGVSYVYEEWGYTYDSFYNAFLSAFTKEAVEEIFKKYDYFLNYNGALFCRTTSSGGNVWSGGAWEVHRVYELISKSDTVIEFRRTVFKDKDNKFNMEFLPEHLSEYYVSLTEFKFVLTENGWRAANIPIEYCTVPKY